MKYIRTEDGRILEVKEECSAYYRVKRLLPSIVSKDFVVKQADAIEELCDGLIVEDKDNKNNWFVMEISEYQSKDNVDKKYMVDRWNFYAFFKTDKGLIYVAKMNDKGELELL